MKENLLPSENIYESYRPAFDGLRAIAISLVWLSHVFPNNFYNGSMGVDIFFVLSGYLITGVIGKEYNQKGQVNIINFYKRRFLRLVPAFWFLLIVVMFWYLLDPNFRPGTLGAIFSAGTYTMNYNRAFAWMGSGLLGHTWSLAIEEQFYLLWPLFIMFVPRARWRCAVLGLILLFTLWRNFLVYRGASLDWVYNSLDCRIDLLFMGCALALGGRSLREVMAPVVCRSWPIALLILLLFVVAPAADRPLTMSLLTSIAGFLTCIVILACEMKMINGVFTSWPVIWFGRISYGLYLWHYPILGLFKFYGFGSVAELLSIPLTIIVATLSFWLIELPFLRLKERMVVVRGRLGVAEPRIEHVGPK